MVQYALLSVVRFKDMRSRHERTVTTHSAHSQVVQTRTREEVRDEVDHEYSTWVVCGKIPRDDETRKVRDTLTSM